VATLKGDVQGGHWQVLRALLPLYEAITTIDLGDGISTSFWFDVWEGDEALADIFPALFSHCTQKEATISELLSAGLQQSLLPRLSRQAAAELPLLQARMGNLVLQANPDKRLYLFAKGEAGIDSKALYRLLKVRGQPEDQRASFIWKNFAAPHFQLFMWLLIYK